MMEIKDIEKLAELAKIELNEEEKKGLLKDLDSILDYVKQISEAEVPEINLDYENKNVWREDIPEERIFSKNLITEQYPDSKDGFIKVKKIL
jgi:aspartyl-tRNA(Asn)/glutamyl-tRNA(Gln) amidotransferase subunit C